LSEDWLLSLFCTEEELEFSESPFVFSVVRARRLAAPLSLPESLFSRELLLEVSLRIQYPDWER